MFVLHNVERGGSVDYILFSVFILYFHSMIFSVYHSRSQISEKKDEFYTLLVFKDISARHSGKYTCFARNSAAKANYTAEMLVRGMCKKIVVYPSFT